MLYAELPLVVSREGFTRVNRTTLILQRYTVVSPARPYSPPAAPSNRTSENPVPLSAAFDRAKTPSGSARVRPRGTSASACGSPRRSAPLLSARISDQRVDPGRLAPASHVPCHAQPLPNLGWQPTRRSFLAEQEGVDQVLNGRPAGGLPPHFSRRAQYTGQGPDRSPSLNSIAPR